MSLSSDSAKRMLIALTSSKAGNEVSGILNNSSWGMPAVIVASNVSSTVNFGALQVGDYVVHIPATAGNSSFTTVATAGTLPVAAVVGDLYVVVRLAAPTAYKL